MSVNIAVPAAALVAAVRVMFCDIPGVSVSVAGCALTPDDNPEIATETVPANPFVGEATTLICWAGPPGIRVRVAGVEVRVKSLETSGLEPLPQESGARRPKSPEFLRIFEIRFIKAPRIRAKNSMVRIGFSFRSAR